MAGLLGGVLPWVYSQGDRAKRNLNGLLADPLGSFAQTAGQVTDNRNQLTGLLDQAFANKQRPFLPTDKAALGQAGEQVFNKLLGFAPVGMTAWHGTPHKFDKFDSSKIGTGEGAQVYGHGLYLAENPEVAKFYQREVGGANGSLYKVDLPDKAVEKMLDWDKPLSKQPQLKDRVLPLLKERVESKPYEGGWGALEDNADNLRQLYTKEGSYLGLYPAEQVAALEHLPGSVVMRILGGGDKSSSAASSTLQRLGIPGVRYLDQGSRGVENGSRNFVVFPGEENMLSILERNGAPLSK